VPARSVALTFDVSASHFDEYAQDIIPALRRLRLHGIFFIMPNQTRDFCDGHTACWPSLLAWRAEGLIDLESHSFTHLDYTTLTPQKLAFDLAHSKALIETRTGQPVLGLCYPFDAVAPEAFDLLAKAGYRFAVAGATRPDRSAEWNDPRPFALPRYYPYSGDASYPLITGAGGETFEQMLMGAVENRN
jgi:peptidoglycan/xylan/chitin deacetylase (PgdA/CDA1 family)